MQIYNINRRAFAIDKDALVSNAFGLSVLSIFLPFKIYPVLFILTSLLMLGRIYKKFYTICTCSLLFLFAAYFSILTKPIDDDILTALIKLTISVMLIISCSLFYFESKNSFKMLAILNKYLTTILIFSFLQIVFLHLSSDWSYLFASNSYDASKLFATKFVYFGGDDKNMFGAKIALFGLLQYIVSSLLKKRNTKIMLAISFLTGALSLSRTPVVFLLAAILL